MLYYNCFSSTMLVAYQNNTMSIFIQTLFDMFWQHFIHLTINNMQDQNYLPKNKIIFAISFSFSKECIVVFTKGYMTSIFQWMNMEADLRIQLSSNCQSLRRLGERNKMCLLFSLFLLDCRLWLFFLKRYFVSIQWVYYCNYKLNKQL